MKPENIIFDADDAPILTDFGLAQITGSLPPLTRTGLPVGTPAYMAPEIAAGAAATAAVDRYALAVVAYEMLTGSLPYKADAPVALLLAHLNQPLPAPSSINPELSAAVENVLVKGLEKDPRDRHATATEFVEALATAAARRTPETTDATRPESSPSVTQRSSRYQAEPQAAAQTDTRLRIPAEVPEPPAPSSRLWMRAAVQAIQDPLAQLPIAAATLAFIYLVLLAPQVGYETAALIVLVAGALLGGAAFVLRLPSEVRRAEAAYDSQRQQRDEERAFEDLQRLQDSLEQGFESAGSTEGQKTLAQLTHEFALARAALTSGAQLALLSMAPIPSVVVETYRRGLSLLVDALDATNTMQSSDRDRLRREVDALESEIARLRPQPDQAERLRLRELTLASHEERLRMLDNEQLREERLLFTAQQCEAALHRARIDLTAIRAAGSGEARVDAVIDALQRTIDQAKAVQAEMRRLGY